MPKLKVTVIGKCPKCGKQMKITRPRKDTDIGTLIWCPNSTCRYAKVIGDE